VSDDWRLRVEFDEEARARELLDRLEAFELAHDLRTAFRDRVIVSRDGAAVFSYTDSRPQADAAARAIEQLAAQHGWHLRKSLERWHPVAERWEDVTDPLPESPGQLAHEHAELVESEREESETRGYPLFEVRVHTPSPDDAKALAERLEAEGVPTAHRWRFVVVGAPDEDTAAALAERIRGEAPEGSTVAVGGSIPEVADDAPFATAFSPFAVFGGLAN
jgi:hypothetical protein